MDSLLAHSAMHSATNDVLDDIVPVFIWFWSKTGKVSEAMYPVYVQTVKLQYNLKELEDSGIYSFEMLESLDKKLVDLETRAKALKVLVGSSGSSSSSKKGSVRSSLTGLDEGKDGKAGKAGKEAKDVERSVQKEKEDVLPYQKGLHVLRAKLKSCSQLLSKLHRHIDAIAPELRPLHSRLIEIKRELQSLLSRKLPSAFSLAEVRILQDELVEIDSVRIDGKYYSRDGRILEGQGGIVGLLELCFEDVHGELEKLIATRDVDVNTASPMRTVYERLLKIRARLERLQITSRWTASLEKELVPLQMALGEIDNMRVDGKFLDGEGQIPEGQAILHFLLHKCYRLVYKLQTSTEIVADSLIPVYNQLLTLRTCVQELRKWKVVLSSRELIPYQLKLASIDNMRIDGKFVDPTTGLVPEGQGILHDLIHDCYEALEILQNQAAEADATEDPDSSSDPDDDADADDEGEEEEGGR
ncbi:hypothetical protein HK102_009251, partial [Quaeritorhiza haematococci]